MNSARQVGSGRLGLLESTRVKLVAMLFVLLVIPSAVIAWEAIEQRRELLGMQSLMLTSVLLLFLGVSAWLGTRKLVLAPLERLREAVDGMGRGDVMVRSGVRHSDSTIGRLARTFDQLAEQNQRVSRALRTLSAGNRTLLREYDERTLLVAMCGVAVENGGYPLAFVNFVNHDAAKSVTTVARYGRDTSFTDTLHLTWADTERGQGSVGTAIRSGQPCVFRSTASDPRFTPWRAEALRRGFLSVVSLPLREAGAVIGTFTLVAEEEDAFGEEELRLLTEMADDLSFGIQTIRERGRQEAFQAQAEWVLGHDAVTGFANRAAFVMDLQRRIAAEEQGLSVTVIHLPYAQKVYDSFGYDSGNSAMREVALRLAEYLGPDCAVARVHNDNFDGIIEMAVKQQAVWMRAGTAVPIEVNLSVRNLYDPHLLDYIQALLENHGVPGERIDFEITESTLMEAPDAALPLLQRIRALGSKIYIDDFGTGYSSLAYLASLPVTALKIDRSFVARMHATDRDRALVASIISMASQLGLQSIAEGVEARDEADALCALGCEQAQRYFYFKPLSVEEMARAVAGMRC